MRMKSLSGVGLGLSLVFGCLLLALIAELYYLLWWKKRIISKRSNEDGSIQIPQERAELFYIFCCWKKPTSSFRSTAQELCSSATHVHEPQSSNPNKDLWHRPFEEEENMGGLPRFLFTITEETREDLESDDGISTRNRKQSTSRSNLSDLLQILETPFLTPIGSPPYFTPPLTPSKFGPFLESERDAEFNRLNSSPPPKFKFLRDAEEKLIQRRKILEENGNGVLRNDEENGPFVTLTIAKSQEEDEGICQNNHSNINMEEEYFSSSASSQVLPLVSSPPTFRSISQQQAHKLQVNFNGC